MKYTAVIKVTPHVGKPTLLLRDFEATDEIEFQTELAATELNAYREHVGLKARDAELTAVLLNLPAPLPHPDWEAA